MGIEEIEEMEETNDPAAGWISPDLNDIPTIPEYPHIPFPMHLAHRERTQDLPLRVAHWGDQASGMDSTNPS